MENNPKFDEITGNSTIDEALRKFQELIYKKLPILEQLSEIIQSFKFDDKNLKVPQFEIDLSFIGISVKPIFDFSIYEKYKDQAFFFIKLSCGLLTVWSVVKNVRGYFGGGRE